MKRNRRPIVEIITQVIILLLISLTIVFGPKTIIGLISVIIALGLGLWIRERIFALFPKDKDSNKKPSEPPPQSFPTNSILANLMETLGKVIVRRLIENTSELGNKKETIPAPSLPTKKVNKEHLLESARSYNAVSLEVNAIPSIPISQREHVAEQCIMDALRLREGAITNDYSLTTLACLQLTKRMPVWERNEKAGLTFVRQSAKLIASSDQDSQAEFYELIRKYLDLRERLIWLLNLRNENSESIAALVNLDKPAVEEVVIFVESLKCEILKNAKLIAAKKAANFSGKHSLTVLDSWMEVVFDDRPLLKSI